MVIQVSGQAYKENIRLKTLPNQLSVELACKLNLISTKIKLTKQNTMKRPLRLHFSRYLSRESKNYFSSHSC